MTDILLTTMFAAAAVLALGAIAGSWRQYGTAALALRRQLEACGQVREVRFALVTTLVTAEARRESARVYRPAFGAAFGSASGSGALRSAPRGLPLQPALRAAA